jgi:hypothetical protein
MPSHQFSIDCHDEEARFRRLLGFATAERVMAIRATGESGKSHFLERCERVCRNADPPVPSASIDCAEFDDGEPVELVRKIRRRFGRAIDFGHFDGLLQNLDMRIWTPTAPTVGLADTRGARFDRATNVNIAGLAVTNTQGPVNVALADPIKLEDEQTLRAARYQCVTAFFEALAAHCAEGQATIIIDTYEQCPAPVAAWLEEEMRERFAADDWPDRLALVLAGRDVPPFQERWQRSHYEERVVLFDGFSEWQPEDIEEGFRELGFDQPPDIFEAIVTFLRKGATPGQVIGLMQLAGEPTANGGQ